MCNYYKKARPSPSHFTLRLTLQPQIFTCSHLSQVYVERCPQASKPLASACTTTDASHDPESFAAGLDAAARTSYFPCFKCLTEAAELENAAAAAAGAARDSTSTAKQARYTMNAAKADANRKAAEGKMRAEREADAVRAEARKAEQARVARGEGTWIESGSVRRKRGRNAGRAGGGGAREEKKGVSAPPSPVWPMGVDAGVGGRAGKMGEFRKENEPRSANEVGGGSVKAGWPKKILAKGEKGDAWGWK